MKRKRPPFIAFFLKGLFNKPRNDPSPTEIEMVNMVSSIRPFMKMIVEKDFSGLAHASSWATTYTPEQITQLIEGIRDEIERYPDKHIMPPDNMWWKLCKAFEIGTKKESCKMWHVDMNLLTEQGKVSDLQMRVRVIEDNGKYSAMFDDIAVF
jgi:hypothetical protein